MPEQMNATARRALAEQLEQLADRRAHVMSTLEVMQLEVAATALRNVAHVQPDEGAPRPALDSSKAVPTDERHRLEALGIVSGVRKLTPASAGHAVRLVVGYQAGSTAYVYLDPQDAATYGTILQQDALEAILADQAVRRG